MPEELRFWESLRDVEDFRKEHDVTYVSFQTEQGAAEDTRHLQGYVELSKPYRLSRLRREFGSRVHFENRMGTQAQAIAYTQKEDTRVENAPRGTGGTPKRLGKDTLAHVAVELSDGKSLEELSTDYPVSFIKHGPNIRSWALTQRGTRKTAPKIVILYGGTGVGKSATAAKEWPEAYWVPWPAKGGWWWANYSGETTVIWDEFRHQIKMDLMLRALDRYPWTIQEKGSSMNFVSKRIVITTNIHPLRWYPHVSYAEKAPLRRRLREFSEFWVFKKDSKYPHFEWEKMEPEVAFMEEGTEIAVTHPFNY